MTRDDIIRMAREAGFEQLGPDIEDWACFTDEIERFAALVATAYAAGAKDKTLKPLTYEQIAELNLSAVTTTDAVNDVRVIELAHGIGVRND